MDLAQLQALLANMGVRRVDGLHLDAGETGFIAKQLEHVAAQTYDIKRAPAKARSFIPVDSIVPSGAESFSYDQWDTVGLARLIANYADDLPAVDAFVKRFNAPIRGLGASYSYSLQDIRAVQFSRGRLNEMKALAARDSVEYQIDQLAAFGNVAAGLSGFLNHSAVPLVTPVVGAWTESTSATDIFKDLNKLVNAIVQATKETGIPDTLLLDTESMGILLKPTGAEFSKTILRAFLDNNPYIKNIDQWHLLDNANVALTGRRIMAYKRDPVVVQLVIPQEFEQLPPQPKNLSFSVPCHARIGGISFHYPLAAAYMDLD
jgi:hypothetical protein